MGTRIYESSDPSPYPPLTQLTLTGKRESTAKDYRAKLSRMYAKLDEGSGMKYPFEDARWLADKDPITNYLDQLKPSLQSGMVSAIRGTLKNAPQLYDQWADESMTMIERPDPIPKQSYTPREQQNWASVKDMLEKLRTLDPYILELLRRRRQCRSQNGFSGQVLVLTVKDRKTLIQWLTLSLYAQTAPCRNDLADIPVIDVPKGNPFDTPPNFMLCKDPSKRPYPEYSLHLSYYKTSSTHGEVIREMPWSVNKHIYESMKIWPRRYLIPQLRDGDKPMGRSYFSTFFAGIFEDKRVTSTTARKAWVTMKDGKERTAEEKAATAREMMHSPAIASRHYLKFEK